MGVITNSSGQRRTTLLPNRLVTYLLIVLGLAAAALPIAANADWQSTAGILGGLAAVATACVTFLKGWQKDEAANLKEYRSTPSPQAQDGKQVDELIKHLEEAGADAVSIKKTLATKP